TIKTTIDACGIAGYGAAPCANFCDGDVRSRLSDEKCAVIRMSVGSGAICQSHSTSNRYVSDEVDADPKRPPRNYWSLWHDKAKRPIHRRRKRIPRVAPRHPEQTLELTRWRKVLGRG